MLLDGNLSATGGLSTHELLAREASETPYLTQATATATACMPKLESKTLSENTT